MHDERITEMERCLWVGEGDIYRQLVSPDCVMVVPEQPFLLRGEEAIATVEKTPRWTAVEFANFQIDRPQEGLIVIGYQVQASRGEEHYEAFCTSTYRRVGEHEWRVIQHQQTPPTIGHSEAGAEVSEQAQEVAAAEREENRGYQ